MKKVLSCKVSDEIYNVVNSLPDNHSTVLRKAIEIYLKSIKISERNKGIPVVYLEKDIDRYKTVCDEVNGFLNRLKEDK